MRKLAAAAAVALLSGCASVRCAHGGIYCDPIVVAIYAALIAASEQEAPLGPLCADKGDPSPIATCPPNRERSGQTQR
jgi:hypothetical protein